MQPLWQGAAAGTVLGVLLAAGRGARFDASARRLKLLEPYPAGQAGAPPLILAAARPLLAAGPVLAVVRTLSARRAAAIDGPNPAQLRRLAELLAGAGCRVVSYTEADRGAADELEGQRDGGGAGRGEGTGASIACAVRASPGAGGWIVALGDMPRIQAATIAAVRRALLDGALTAAPYFQGRRGHPVGFGAACEAQLAALAGDQGARAVLQRHPPVRIDVDDPGVLFDVDRPEDLQAAPGSGE